MSHWRAGTPKRRGKHMTTRYEDDGVLLGGDELTIKSY